MIMAFRSAGFNTTVFPAPIAGPTLCATKFNGKLNGVIAPITPIGFRIVYAIRPSAPGAASNGNVSPYIRFASSAANLYV